MKAPSSSRKDNDDIKKLLEISDSEDEDEILAKYKKPPAIPMIEGPKVPRNLNGKGGRSL